MPQKVKKGAGLIKKKTPPITRTMCAEVQLVPP
jgi:hypothetical protein